MTGSISATFKGTTASANLFNGESRKANVVVKDAAGKVYYDKKTNALKDLKAGNKYNVRVDKVGFNFGANNAGKEVTLTMPKDSPFSFDAASVKDAGWTAVTTTNGKVTSIKGNLDNNGTVNNLVVSGDLTALDTTNTNNVVFYNVATGQPVTAGIQ